MNKKRKIGLFIGITFAISWAMVIIFAALGGKWDTLTGSMVAIVFMFIPMISAILVQKVIYKEPLREPLGISFGLNRWWLAPLLLWLLVTLATLGVVLLIPGIEYSIEILLERFTEGIPPEQLQLPKSQIWVLIIIGQAFALILYSICGFGEELGFKHPEHPIEVVASTMLLYLLLAPISSYIRLRSKSVIPCAINYGIFKTIGGLPFMVVKGPTELIELAGYIILFVVNLCIFLFGRFIAKKPVSLLM